ncbi:MAG: hypothetical protein MJB12_05235 [Firmicutes bacterium]|nr:hypothetical protein [Bacillota bacterium]
MNGFVVQGGWTVKLFSALYFFIFLHPPKAEGGFHPRRSFGQNRDHAACFFIQKASFKVQAPEIKRIGLTKNSRK